MESPESIVPGPVAVSVVPPPNSSLAGGLDALKGQEGSRSESSAWITAVRPKERG